MALDFAKYRTLFLEEADEHLQQISSALLELEKDPCAAEPIDLAFRMAHSIKSMAATLEYTSVTEVAHALEDRMEGVRRAGGLSGGDEMAPLFRGLEGLEAMVAAIRDTGESPAPNPGLVEALRAGGATGSPGDVLPSSGLELQSEASALTAPVAAAIRTEPITTDDRLKKKLLS